MQEYRRRGLQWSQLLCLPVLLSCNMQIFGYTMSICYVPLRLAFFTNNHASICNSNLRIRILTWEFFSDSYNPGAYVFVRVVYYIQAEWSDRVEAELKKPAQLNFHLSFLTPWVTLGLIMDLE